MAAAGGQPSSTSGLIRFAGDEFERVEVAGASAAGIDGDGVDLQQITHEGHQPRAQILGAVGRFEQRLDATGRLAPARRGGVFALGQ